MLFSLLPSLGIIGGADGPTAIFVTGVGSFLLWYLAAVNLAALLLYGIDKLQAKRGGRRIRERTLLLLALLGGSVGAWLGMRLFRHKTRHAKFRYGVPLILAVQIALALFLMFRGA